MRVEVAWSSPNAPADAATDAQAPPKSLKRCGVAARSETRLLTRHLEEVWFPGHACHALATSLFTSLFAGKREVAPASGQNAARARLKLAGEDGPFCFGLVFDGGRPKRSSTCRAQGSRPLHFALGVANIPNIFSPPPHLTFLREARRNAENWSKKRRSFDFEVLPLFDTSPFWAFFFFRAGGGCFVCPSATTGADLEASGRPGRLRGLRRGRPAKQDF